MRSAVRPHLFPSTLLSSFLKHTELEMVTVQNCPLFMHVHTKDKTPLRTFSSSFLSSSPGWPRTCDPLSQASKCWDHRHEPPSPALRDILVPTNSLVTNSNHFRHYYDTECRLTGLCRREELGRASCLCVLLDQMALGRRHGEQAWPYY